MGTLDLYNVLDKLKQIENPTEDQQQAIKQTEAMTKAPEGAVQTDATGSQTYKPYGTDSTPEDLGRLAGAPEKIIKEAVELKEDEDVARDFAMNITDHILNQYDKGGLGDIVVTGTVLKGIEDTINNADFTMHDNEKKDMAIAITKIIRDEFGDGKGAFNIPKDADGYSFELQDVISDYIMKAGSMEEMPAESVEEGRMSDAMIGAEELIFGYFDGEGLPIMSDDEMIADLEAKKSANKDPQKDMEISIAIDMIEKGEHIGMNEAHCNTKRKKTEDADPVDDKDPAYADDMHLDKPMSKQEKDDQDYVDNYDRNEHIANLEDELGEVEAMIAGTKDQGEIRTYNYIAADIRDQIERLKAGEDITDYGPEDDFIEKIKPQEGKDMKELKIMDDLQAKFESEMQEESKKETVAESTETKKETVNEDYSITMDMNETGDRSVQVSAANESADELLDLLNLSGLRSKGYTEVSEDDINEDELANAPDEKIQTDVDAQWNGAAGGNAKPNHVSAQKSNSFPLHASVEESVTEEKMTDLYKEYKAEEEKGE